MRILPLPSRTIRAALARSALPLAVALLGGCALFAPQLEPPKLSVVGVELVKGDLFEQRLRARVRVQNPNDRELAVKGLTYTIEVGGEEFGRGMSGSSFVVPGGGEAEFDMMVTANMAGTLLRFASRAQQGEVHPDAIDYRIVGKVSLASGVLRSIPFEHKGTLKLR
jgi:LEA14-like dessication related protein